MTEKIFTWQVKKFLTILVAFHLLLLLGNVPFWVLLTALALISWKGLHWLKGIRGPKKWEIWLIGACGLAYIYFTRRTLMGEEAGSMVLSLMAGCKLAESETYRDYSITLILCFLLLTVYLIGSQSLVSLMFLLLDVVLLVQFLFQLHPSGNSVFSLKAVFRLLGLMLPVWLLFFFIFPRFTVGFWHHQNLRSTTGFSEELDPGRISQLAESDEIAFRVKFKTPPSRSENFYWRGSVLTLNDGLKWMKPVKNLLLEENLKSGSKGESYQVWLDPLFERWLFLLDFVKAETPLVVTGNGVRRKAGFVSELVRPVTTRISYEAVSLASPRVQGLSADERKVYLQMPAETEEQVIKLAAELRDKEGDTKRSILNLEAWFRNQAFVYTLNPGQVPGGSLGGFLFQSKRGFCEHYAAAAAFLLRAMGIPSRVVVGFQGAESNFISDYWIVRNRNAHAWSEVFVETDVKLKLGYWERLDLVATVMPVRTALGAEYFQFNESSLRNAGQLSLEDLRNSVSWLARTQIKGRLIFDAVEMKWVTFLTEYDLEYQRSLLKKVGFRNTAQSVFFGFLASVLAAWFLIYSLYQRSKQERVDPLLRIWHEFSRIFKASGKPRHLHEGPEQFMRRLKSDYPQFASEIDEIGTLYISLRYERPPVDAKRLLSHLENRVKTFKKRFHSARF